MAGQPGRSLQISYFKLSIFAYKPILEQEIKECLNFYQRMYKENDDVHSKVSNLSKGLIMSWIYILFYSEQQRMELEHKFNAYLSSDKRL